MRIIASRSTAYQVGNGVISTLAFTLLALIAFPFVALLTFAWAEKRFFERRRRGQTLREPARPERRGITDPLRPATAQRSLR